MTVRQVKVRFDEEIELPVGSEIREISIDDQGLACLLILDWNVEMGETI